MFNLQNILLPFGTSATGVSKSIILYVIIIFAIVFIPVYFLVIKSDTSGGLFAILPENTIENIQKQIVLFQTIIERNNQLIKQYQDNADTVNNLTATNENLNLQINSLNTQLEQLQAQQAQQSQ